jgi:hypothetical protein
MLRGIVRWTATEIADVEGSVAMWMGATDMDWY